MTPTRLHAVAAANGETMDLQQIITQIAQIATGQAHGATDLAVSQDSIVQAMGSLKESLRAIQEISSFIKEVAEQTNLLGLNAAIEAARVGDQGRGFGVVAEEIRKLAHRSQDSITQITSALDAITTHSRTVDTQIQNMKAVADQQSASATEMAQLVQTLRGTKSL